MHKPTSSEASTEAIVKGGVIVKVGRSKWAVPTASIIGAILAALGTAYQVVSSEREKVWATIAALQAQDQSISQKLELEQVVLAEIRTQLSRIDARVAEVQVTLMRGGR